MKQYLKLMSLTVLFALIAASKRLMAQESPVFKRKTEIKTSQVQEKTKDGKTVRYVDPASLKKGFNYLTLSSGDILYAEYGNGKIKSISLTSKTGAVKDKVIISGGATQFQCGPGFCVCRGDGDCNDMFTTNVCGPNAICFGDICVCSR